MRPGGLLILVAASSSAACRRARLRTRRRKEGKRAANGAPERRWSVAAQKLGEWRAGTRRTRAHVRHRESRETSKHNGSRADERAGGSVGSAIRRRKQPCGYHEARRSTATTSVRLGAPALAFGSERATRRSPSAGHRVPARRGSAMFSHVNVARSAASPILGQSTASR